MSPATTAPTGSGQLVLTSKTVCQVPQLRTLFVKQLPELEGLYPASMKAAAARLARAVLTEVQKNELLGKSTGMSLLSCAVQAATLNLEIGGPTGQSFLVPYFNNNLKVYEAQFQLGYRGMITLAYRSQRIASITAQLVREGDTFRVKYGTQAGIEHEPGKVRGVPSAAYAVVTYKGGGVDFDVMAYPEIDEHRKRYSKMGTDDKGNAKGIWRSAFDAMALKTVLRKVLKRCPIGVDLGPDETDEPGFTVDVPPMEPEPRALESGDDNGIDESHGDAWEGDQTLGEQSQ